MGKSSDNEPLRHIELERKSHSAGIIANADALLGTHPEADRTTRIDWLQSNICRCTGYETIERVIDRAQEGISGEDSSREA